MVMRTRRQVGGCVAAVDAALRQDMSRRLPQIEPALETLASGHVWSVISQHPELISPALFAQFRLRAAMGLLSGSEDGEAARLLHGLAQDDPTIAGQLATLVTTQARWNDRGVEDAPIVTDLPAVAMEELVSLCCAVLVQALMSSDIAPVDRLLDCANHSCDAILARHDEEAGALGAAAWLARAMDGRMLDDALLCALAQEGQLLLCAILAQRCAAPLDQVGLALVDGRDDVMLALCKVADLPDEAAILLQMYVDPVRPTPRDAALAAMIDRYEAMTVEEARALVAPLALPANLTDKMVLIGMKASG